jgi:hypothetical protein
VYPPAATSSTLIATRAEQAERNVGGLGFKLTPEHLMDCAQAATAAVPVSQPGVGIEAMPM